MNKSKMTVFVVAVNNSGEMEILAYDFEMTQEDFDNDVHYDAAKAKAEAAEYGISSVFDSSDLAAKQLFGTAPLYGDKRRYAKDILNEGKESVDTILNDVADTLEAHLVHGEVSEEQFGSLIRRCRNATDNLPDPYADAHIKVEYDTAYTGGDYNGVGDFAYIPMSLIDAFLQQGSGDPIEFEDALHAAFRKQMHIDSMHIVHFSTDGKFNKDGSPFDEELAALRAQFPSIEFEDVDQSYFGYKEGCWVGVTSCGTYITDPFLSSCGRFEVEPLEVYEIPKQAASMMVAINRRRAGE